MIGNRYPRLDLGGLLRRTPERNRLGAFMADFVGAASPAERAVLSLYVNLMEEVKASSGPCKGRPGSLARSYANFAISN